ncbi:phosphonate ABC transporter ATP-binding protein [Chelativorans xinjiangense]|uniref:phosphonate ABC transporter ATP-binding protein n=1 Tax=Chelativorans xinjiangense TaxID=2681485 RepID=UPI00135AA135|nr:phosphonate ABC transporter ATP-binding protein [Chelativorans xinjiangense]
MLEIRGVTRRFGKTVAVDGIDVEIDEGQMVGIIGRSGAGKSTLLRMINRLIDPSEGSIAFQGVEVSALKGAALRRWQRDCAMIFQQFNLVPRLDVLTNVLLGRLNHRPTALNLLSLYSRDERIQAIAALERLDIAHTALQQAGTLSGGQQQRVAIARALMQEPKVILADEPIASLDPLNAKVVMDSLADINAREGITVITNLHTLDTARHYSTRIIGMAGGAVVFDGAPEALTAEAVQRIYGADGGDAVSETITSTSIQTPAEPYHGRVFEPALAD